MSDKSDHSFHFRVTGVELSEQTKERISREISAAVARTIVADHPQVLEGEIWSRFRINGGKWIASEDALEIANVLSDHAPSLLAFGED